MIFFIVVLRALATCLITNCHYIGVYPTDMLANGGLLGDVIFFAVSGYCLLNVKKSFPAWYGKRLWRIYPAVTIILVTYLLMGFYQIGSGGILTYFVYPTYYHFVGSIIVLYIPFYFIGRYECLKKRIPLIAIAVGVFYLIIYVFFYDKSYYHIDNVHERMIRFLFFESMLLGGYFKYNNEKFQNKFNWSILIGFVVTFVLYFAFKFAMGKTKILYSVQLFSQILMFGLLFFVFWLLASIDVKLEKLPKLIKVLVTYLSNITLEIYVVQFPIIFTLRHCFAFPINWIVITASILAAATALHCVCKLIYFAVDKVIEFLKNIFNKKEEKV